MSISYEFNTASYSVEELSDVFGEVLDIGRVKPLAPSPLSGESWWAAAVTLDSGEFTDSGERLQAPGSYTSITFEPRKSLSWEEQTRGLARIVATVVDLLARKPDSSGFLMFNGDIVVLEKRRGRGIVADPRLVDPDDLDDQGAFVLILVGCAVEPIDQD